MSGQFCVIGTAGHVDHGKTALVRALTGIDTDRLAEEQRRGITIETGFAWLALPGGGRAGVIDVPGHEKLIRNMLAGTGGVDLALFVVAADEGVMPQTREHLGILSLLGVQRGVIALTKADLADSGQRARAAAQIRDAAAGTFLENAPLIAVSTCTGEGLEALRDSLFALAACPLIRRDDLPFRLSVDRAFTKAGFGSIATGTLLEGQIAVGDTLAIYPTGTAAKVRAVQVYGQATAHATAGRRVAINLAGGIKKETLPRGCVLAAPGSVPVTDRLDVRLRLLPDAAFAVKNASRLHFYSGARETLCRVTLFGSSLLCAGGEAFAQLRFDEPLAIKAGDRFVVRFFSPMTTVGGGVVIDPLPAKHRRTDITLPQRLERLLSGAPDERLDEIARTQPPFTSAIPMLRLNLAPAEIDTALRTLTERGTLLPLPNGCYVHCDFLDMLGARADGLLARFHAENPLRAGMRRAALRQTLLPDCAPAVADAALALLAREKRCTLSGDVVQQSGFAVTYTPAQQAMRDALLAAYEQGGFSPPDSMTLDAQLAGKDGARALSALLATLCRQGVLVETDAHTRFSRAHFDEALRRFAALEAKHGAVTLAQLRDALGTSRKFAQSLLEYCDRAGITGDAENTIETGKIKRRLLKKPAKTFASD